MFPFFQTRNELNHQQSVQIQSQKQLLAEKHKELFELDAQIDKYTNDLQQKRSQSNHIDTLNHQVNGSTSPTDEQDFVEMDYSSLSSFTKRPNKTNNADSTNGTGNAPVTSGSFRGRGRNGRKLETLLEVEEEVSDGHASNKSSTEDLTQGPGPPRASRVTALKSRFGVEGVTSAKLSNRSSSPARRVEPEGVETPPEMFGLDGLRSVDAVRENRYYNMNEFLDISSLQKRPCHQNGEESNQTLQEETFEEKPQPAPGSSESSTPSDGDDFSGHSSPLSFASSSSVSSNSSTAKAAVFAITGVARQASTFSPPTEPTQPQNSESASPQRSLREITNTGKYQGLSNSNKFETFSAKLEKPSRGVLYSERSAEDPPLQARLVKSEGFPTKNEKVGSVTRATLLDFSRTGVRPQRSVEKSTWKNQATSNSAEQKVPSLTEVKAFEAKPERISGTSTKPALDLKSRSDREQGSNLTELKTMDSSVKSGKLPLSRLQYLTATPVNSALPQQHATNNSESQMRLQRNVEDPSLYRNEETPLEDTAKKGVNFSWTTSKGNSVNAFLPRLPQNSIKTNGLVQEENSVESLHGIGHSREEQRYERDSNRNDETDSADKTTVDRSLTPPLVFRPISYRAKKLGGGQSNVNTSADRSQLASPTFNSVSIRGQSSSLTKITVTPSASYYTGKNTNIPEQRSPVPTSKRSRFMFRGVVPTSPENDDLGDDTFDEGYEQKHEEFSQNEYLDQETAQTNREQGNKVRSATRPNSKQVVSSFNIQLSSQSKKANQEQDKFSSLEKSTGSYPSDEKYETAGPAASGVKVSAGKELNFESGRLSSESDRLNSEGDRVSPDSGRLHHGSGVLRYESGQLDYESSRLSSVSVRLSTESGRLTSEGSSDKSLECSPTVSSPDRQTSPTTSGESKTGVNVWTTQAEQSAFIKNVVTSSENESQKTNGETLPNELLFARNRLDVNEDDTLPERAPGSNQSRKNVETKQGITAKDFSLEITDVNTARHVPVNRDIGPGSQLNNSISDRFLSNTLEASPVKATIDDTSNPLLVNGDVGLLGNSHENVSSDGTEEAVAPARKTARKKKARHVSLDPHAVLLDAAVEGELDLVKQVVREVLIVDIPSPILFSLTTPPPPPHTHTHTHTHTDTSSSSSPPTARYTFPRF